MVDNVLAQIDALIAHSGVLLGYAQAQQWETFNAEVETYIRTLNALKDVRFDELEAREKEDAAQRLEILLAADATVMQCIRARLNELSAEMATLRKKRTSVHAYAAV